MYRWRYVAVGVMVVWNLLWAGEIKPSLQEIIESAPPDTQIAVIVHMVEQPDFSGFGINEKPQIVLYAKNLAQISQADLLSYLNTQSGSWSDLKSFWVFNGLYLKATPALIESLAARSDVDYIVEDFQVILENGPSGGAGSTEWNITKVHADEAWENGITGEGVIVGNMDTGVDVDHPALVGKWRSDHGWYDAVNGEPEPYDDHGHGTHTMGTICGGDGLGPFEDDIGVAPGATFIAVKAFDSEGVGNASWIHSGFQWVADLATYGLEPDVMNNSWGSYSTTRLEFWQDILMWRALGIIPVFSIGNNGPGSGTAGTPGNYPTVIGVGATDSDDDIAYFSSRGPAPNMYPWNDPTFWPRDDWDLIKPNLSAPGVSIRSSLPGGGYGHMNGTSMAAPHVTGAIALLLEVKPDLGFEEIYSLLVDGADHPTQGEPYPNNSYGWGRLNVYQSILLIPQVELLWPNAPEIVVEEADTYQVRYNGDAGYGITNVKAYFSYNGGQTWPDTIGARSYDGPPYPTHVENHTIEWPVTQHPTEHGRVKVVLYDAANQTAVDISSYDITVKLARPGNLTASVSSDLESITLTWTDRSNYEDGYKIQRREPGGDWQEIATLPANATSFVDNSVEPFADYEYRIWAYGNGITSDTVYTLATTDAFVASPIDGAIGRHASHFTYNNGILHMVFSHSDTVFYTYSNDGGVTWSQPIALGCGANPSIASNGNYTAVVWDKDSTIFYSLKVGDGFTTPSGFRPTGTRMNAYNPTLIIYQDTVMVAFSANNDHYPFVLYKTFSVSNPPSGVVLCDTIWSYSHHLDSIVVKGITSYSTEEGRYFAISLWGYGYVDSSKWGHQVRVFEKLPDSSSWQNTLEDYSIYISNPVVDSANGKIYIALSSNGQLSILERNISQNNGWQPLSLWAAGAGPLFLSRRHRVLMAVYRNIWSSTMDVLVASYIDHIWHQSDACLAFDEAVAAGLEVKEVRNWASEYYYAMVPVDRYFNEFNGRYFKDRLVYSYTPERSPLQGGEKALTPSTVDVRLLGTLVKGAFLEIEFYLPKRSEVQLDFYDVSGKLVASHTGSYRSGMHVERIETKGLPSGVYFLRAKLGRNVMIRKFMVIR